jgi:hypothetical protein
MLNQQTRSSKLRNPSSAGSIITFMTAKKMEREFIVFFLQWISPFVPNK